MASSKWTLIHTVYGILLLICLISVFKNPFIYFEDYAQALHLTNFQYSIILLSLYAGNITSLFFGVYINNLFKDKYQSISSVFSFISGALSLLFCLITYFTTNSNSNNSNVYQIFIVIYGSIIAFLFKNASSICYATMVGLANEWSEHHNKGANIAYLQLSWSVSTLLYIPIGFMLQYLFWWVPFLIFGSILIMSAFVINWGFSFEIQNVLSQQQELLPEMDDKPKSMSRSLSEFSAEVASNISDLKRVFNKHINLILGAIFFCSIAQGSFLITTSSFWLEDVYGLSTSMVGLVTLSIFLAEVVGSIVMTQISDSYGIFVCSFIAFMIEIIASLIILNLSVVYGSSIGGLSICIILIFFLFVGWEIFFITQVLAMIEFAPGNISKNIVLLSNFAVASVAKMIGAEFSSLLWYDGNGLSMLSAIWLVANILALSCYSILYKIKDENVSCDNDNDYMPIGDADTQHVNIND